MPATTPEPQASTYRTIDDLDQVLAEAIDSLTAARAEAAAARSVEDLYDVLSHVTNALHDAIESEARTVAVWRNWGASWTEVGQFYGTTRQAAQQRFSTTGTSSTA